MNEYFAPNFFESRRRFRAAAESVGAYLHSLPIDTASPLPEPLSIDIAWIGAPAPRQALVHSSGLHGVELFAGSAIQLRLLHEPLPELHPDTALILIHGINPWGAWALRRTNEHNVDLNRNCLLVGEDWSGAPEGYRELSGFLNPASPPRRDFFLLRGSLHVLRNRMRTLRQSIAGGQHEYPNGLFFGGLALQQEPRELLAWLATSLIGVERIAWLDIHTGTGKYGSDTLITDAGKGTSLPELKRFFGNRVEPSVEENSIGYDARGRLGLAVQQVLPDACVTFAVHEFGTYAGPTVLHALREENRWHQYGEKTFDHPTKERLRETFCPQSLKWRTSLLRLGSERFQAAALFLRS